MKRRRVKDYRLHLVQLILVSTAISCRPDILPNSWSVQVNYMEGTPVDSAWLVLLKETGHSGNWQDNYTLEPIGDTLFTNSMGSICVPIQDLEGKYEIHIGTQDYKTGLRTPQYEGTCHLPIYDSATILLPTPFWIRCVGGRNGTGLTANNSILLWNSDDLGPSQPSGLYSFTPGKAPTPSVLIKSFIHPIESLPATRVWHAAARSSSGQLHSLPSLSISIDHVHLIDTMVVEQFW
jgi:hypothetical protein